MIRPILVFYCATFALPFPAWASVDICSDPQMQSRLSLEFTNFDEFSIDQGVGTIDQQYNNYDLLFSAAQGKYLFGVGHRYDIFDVNPTQTETNGHQHTFFLPFHMLSEGDRDSFRFSAAAGLSASSNLFNHSGVMTNDAVQLLAALVWGKDISTSVSLRYGVCGDHRFGEYRAYPAASVVWQPHPDWRIQLGFPDSRLSYRISDSFSSDVSISPDGNEWQVADKSLTNHSQFIYEAYAIEWSLDWVVRDRFTITASVGEQFHNRYELTLIDQSRVRLSGDTITRMGAALEWRF